MTYDRSMSEYSGASERWHAQDVRRLATETMLSERTVYRWFEKPTSTTRGNRMRLQAAASKLGIQAPGVAA